MPDYTPNFAGIVDALKTIITTGIGSGKLAVDRSKILIQLPYVFTAISGDLILIPAVANKKIRVYCLTLTLNGTAENSVLVKDGSVQIDYFVLLNRGGKSGFIAEIPIYTLSVNSALILNFSVNSGVAISNLLYEYAD